MKKFVIFYAFAIAGIAITLSCGDRDPIEIFREFNLRVTSEKLMITLSWDRIADDDLTGYNLYRSAGGGELELYKVLETEDSSYVDSTVSSDVVYGYQVTAAFVGGRESDPSEEERIIPGPTITWVFDWSSARLVKMSHDVAHTTSDVFNDLISVAAFDVDENTGNIYLLDSFERSLILLQEGKNPLVLKNEAGNVRRFEDPTDVKYDPIRDDFWITDGLAGSIFHFENIDSTTFVLADTFSTGGDAVEGQLDAVRGSFWVVNNKQNSIVIYSREIGGFQQTTVGGFSGNSIMLALDEIRGLAYAANRSNGDFFRISAIGVKTELPSLNGVVLGAVEPSVGDLWLILDDNGNGLYDLAKLSEVGSRIITLADRYSDPRWIGVNPFNSNVVVMDAASSGASIEVFTNTGEILSRFGSFIKPLRGRILLER